jgi:hypothetical protein
LKFEQDELFFNREILHGATGEGAVSYRGNPSAKSFATVINGFSMPSISSN